MAFLESLFGCTTPDPTLCPTSGPTHSVEFLGKLTADDGTADDEFGYRLSLSNDFVAVGSRYDDDKVFNHGSVYLFNTTDESLIHKLTADDGNGGHQFGHGVSLWNDVVAVSTPYGDENCSQSGSMYLFRTRDGSLIHKLTRDGGVGGDLFGWSVSLSNGIVALENFVGTCNIETKYCNCFPIRFRF